MKYPILYRGFTIESDYIGYKYYKGDIDCEYTDNGWKSNVKNASSIAEAKREIDDYYFEQQEYTVAGVIFLWLSDAMEYAKQCKSIVEPRLQFDSI